MILKSSKTPKNDINNEDLIKLRGAEGDLLGRSGKCMNRMDASLGGNMNASGFLEPIAHGLHAFDQIV